MVAIAGSLVAAKATKETLRQLAGYDFVGLLTRIVIFYVVALVIAKIFELMIFSAAGIRAASNLFGIPMPSHVPDIIRKLFDEGYQVGALRIKWWDLIKIVSVLMVTYEMILFMQNKKAMNEKPSPTTLGIFVLIISGLTVISFADLYQIYKERQLITR